LKPSVDVKKLMNPQAPAHLKTFSADEEMRYRAFVHERALMDEISEKRAEREIGKREQAIDILTRQLTRRFGTLSNDTLDRLNIATTEQLEHWTDTILDAKTLKAVFDGH
jgi:Domain of unknown function (DUF4351)